MPRLASLAALLLSGSIATAALADSQYFHKTFSGTIDGRYAFTMDLKNVDGNLTGSYRYAGKRNDIDLSGKIDSSGILTMEENADTGRRTGTFNGKLVGDELSGTWASAGSDRRLPFDAHQTSEIIIGSKREILTHAIGTYVLDRISGSGGANNMWDSWRVKGQWKSVTADVVAARPDPSDVKLTHEDVRRLNSMTVTVDASLTTRLSVGDKVLLTIPYRDAGLVYDISQPHDRVVEDELKPLSPDTTVHDERLFLLARDKIDFVPAMSGSFLSDDNFDIATVSYAIVDQNFEVRLWDGGCCAVTAFTFVHKR